MPEPAPSTSLPFVDAPSLALLIEARASATPDAPMLFDEHDRCVTFAGYANEVDQVARRLAALGVSPGDVVAWQLPTRIETLVVMGALARLAAIQVPVLPIHRERELRFMLGQSNASRLFVPGTWRGIDYEAMARTVQDELGTFTVDVCAPLPEPRPAPPASLPPVPTDGDLVRWLYYSSGTTADPKGVMHVDRAGITAGRAMAESQGFAPGDRYGVAFPFTHIGGLANLAAVLTAGFALILIEVFDPPAAVAVFGRNGATIVGGGPAFYRAFLEQQRRRPAERILPALRFMTGGGTAMPPAMHHEVRAEIGGRGCAHGYGMTEACSIFAMNHPDDTDERLTATVGRIVPSMDGRVALPDGTIAPPGTEGEIEVRGEHLFVGYLDGSLDDDAFHDGWFRTGDLGSIDTDG